MAFSTLQNGVTIVAPVSEGRLEALQALLDTLGSDVEQQSTIQFGQFQTLHFCRFYVVRSDFVAAGCKPPDDLLFFSLDFDGAWADHLAEWLKIAADGLHQIFSHCEGYPANSSVDSAVLRAFLDRRRLPIQTFYVGSVNSSVRRIRAERTLRDAVQTYVDSKRGSAAWLQLPPEAMRSDILNHVRPVLPTELSPTPPFSVPRSLIIVGLAALFLLISVLIGAAVAALAGVRWYRGSLTLLAVEAVLIVVAALWFRGQEKRDPTIATTGDIDNARKVAGREDHIVQNQMTILTPVKPGFLRQVTLRGVLAVVNLAARISYNRGDLGGIPSIHFARWFLFDGGRWMIFQSNYDGSWQSYLSDFIDKEASGLTAIWSNTREFPRTEWLVNGGATDEQRFKAIVRDRQIVTQLWYCAYPELSKENIANNAEIARGLQEPAAVSAADWLGCLQGRVAEIKLVPAKATTYPTPKLEREDIQGIIPFAYDQFDHACYVHLRIGDAVKARRWLAGLLPHVQGSATKAKGHALNLGFTVSGLRRLGLDEATLETFSREFQEGMAEPARARSLGDDPKQWDWGKDEATTPDVLLLLYAENASGLQELLSSQTALYTAAGLTPIVQLNAQTLSHQREHFGFRDGISNPVIRGRGPAPKKGEAVVAAGEFVLGYANEYGRLPFSPTVSAKTNGSDVLPPGEDPRGGRDLGRNGSYLAYRQIEQDVHGFWDYLNRQAATENHASDRHYLGAKIVGRWMNGSPLLQHPDQPGTNASNEFLYQKQDPRGMRCPFGSHIRRSNPRDSLVGSTTAEAQLVSQRHHLLRRGMSYGPAVSDTFDPDEILKKGKDQVERGLNFLCFNANLGRQFEFVQQTWLANPKFGGLAQDADPLVSAAPGNFTVPACPVRRQLPGLAQFTRVRGGAYYFLPGLRALAFLSQ